VQGLLVQPSPFWLKAAGFQPTLVEHAPALRFERIKDDTEVIFGDEVVGMQQMPVYVQIEFKHGKSTPIRSGHWRG
jgi:hypothetical protein